MKISFQVRMTGPLTKYWPSVWQDLVKRGYTPLTARSILYRMDRLSSWMEKKGVGAESINENLLTEFCKTRCYAAGKPLNRRLIEPLICSLVNLKAIEKPTPNPPAPPSEVARFLAPFLTYLRCERGFVEHTIQQYDRVIGRFFIARFGSDEPKVGTISADDLSLFILRESRCYKKGTVKISISALRCFIRYQFVKGFIDHDLSGSIPVIANWRLSELPKYLETTQVDQLLRAPDQRTHVGYRDYAVLLLLTRLGLRSKEVASIELRDIDWQQGVLIIRGKGRKQECLPLPSDVGAALVRYLKIRRTVPQIRNVFIGVNYPLNKCTASGIRMIVKKYAIQSGIPNLSSHKLRHTLATEILRKGGSLDEIAQVLRHADHDSTAIYAKVDLASLNTVVQGWPGGVA